MVFTVSEIANLWDRVLRKINARLDDRNIFDSFFEGSYIHEIKEDNIIVAVNSRLAAQLINSKYMDFLHDVVSEETESNYKLTVVSKDELTANKQVKIEQKQEVFFKDSHIFSKFTFDNFVVGAFNRDASQAALMIASNPGKMFNPLFIHSDSGLGKTHLLHAIANYVKSTKYGAKIVCITADDFFNEYVRALQTGKDTTALRDFCKTVDVFLIDDIQFLNDKKKTQELFYHVFNDLVRLEKQIVITSDKQPNELKDIEDRLVTRFGSGLTVQINEPDRDTCIEILKKKIESNNIQVRFDDASLILLADKFSKNVRELEGALNKLVYYSILKQTNQIDVDLTIEAVSTLIGGKYIADEITEQNVISLVADYYNMTPYVLTGNSRTRQIVLARHVAMYLIRSILDVPLKKIGSAFGGKDHTTVMSGISNVEKLLKTDENMQKAIAELKSRIKKD